MLAGLAGKSPLIPKFRAAKARKIFMSLRNKRELTNLLSKGGASTADLGWTSGSWMSLVGHLFLLIPESR